VPDLPLCLGVVKHRAPVARGGGGGSIFLPKYIFYDGFLLMWYNLKILTIPKFSEHVMLKLPTLNFDVVYNASTPKRQGVIVFFYKADTR